MRIADLGEFPLIARLAQIITRDRPDVLVGIGDDVAVLAGDGDELLLATIDIQVEGVHFRRDLSTPFQVGRRALAVNLSDIAAMGGRPWATLVSLALPPDTEVAWVDELYRGLRAEADRWGVAIVGGNMTRAPGGIGVDIALLGWVRREHVLLRVGARPGDRVLVTGQLGDAAAGLRLALNPDLPASPADRAVLLERYLTPTPRLAEAAVIARTGQATAMIDLSDGLSSDIGHVCDRSGVGVRVWAARLPISVATAHVAAALAVPAWELALVGGDDYELCFTAPPDAAEDLAAVVTRETGTPATVVGEILPADQGRRLVLLDGQELALTPGGWAHF